MSTQVKPAELAKGYNVSMSLLSDRIKLAMAETDPPTRSVDLSRITKVSKATISDWTSGKSKEIKSKYLFIVAKALKVGPEWLANNIGPMCGPTPNRKTKETNLAENEKPTETQPIPIDALLRIMRIVNDGIGTQRFNNYPDFQKKRILGILYKITTDSESKDLSDEFIIKLMD